MSSRRDFVNPRHALSDANRKLPEKDRKFWRAMWTPDSDTYSWARPKSIKYTLLGSSQLSTKFSIFRSPWMNLFLWRISSRSRIWIPTFRIVEREKLSAFIFSRTSLRFWPWASISISLCVSLCSVEISRGNPNKYYWFFCNYVRTLFSSLKDWMSFYKLILSTSDFYVFSSVTKYTMDWLPDSRSELTFIPLWRSFSFVVVFTCSGSSPPACY